MVIVVLLYIYICIFLAFFCKRYFFLGIEWGNILCGSREGGKDSVLFKENNLNTISKVS